MDFEQYLERDILTFLDSKIYKKENTSIDREEEYGLYLTKDYLKELNYALDNDELTRAKKLFDELKANYSKLPKNSVERKKIYSLLEKMYEKIQNYVRIKEGKIEIIKQGELEILKDNTEKFSSLSSQTDKPISVSDNKTSTESAEAIIKRTQLPIRIGAKTDVKKDQSNENILLDKKKHEQETAESEAPDNTSAVTESEPISKEKTEKIISKEIKRRNERIEAEGGRISEFPEINQKVNQKREVEKPADKDRVRDEWKEEIIHKTTKHLEKLKVHVVDKLLEELRKKLDEKSDEQNKKIESLRNEIVTQVIEELDKRLRREKRAVSEKIELLRDEILDKVYQQAPQIISSNDNYNNYATEKKHYETDYKDLSDENYNPMIADSYSENTEPAKIDSTDMFKKTYDTTEETKDKERGEIGEIYIEKTQLADGQYSNYTADDLRAIYEQAIYYMFENKYSDAAILFKKIIDAQPTNKAAQIRLRECIEKQPTGSTINQKENAKELVSEIENLTEGDINDTYTEMSVEESESMSRLDDTLLNEPLNNFTSDIRDITSDDSYNSIMLDQYGNKINTAKYKNSEESIGKYSDEELRVVYEQAIYYMSDNKYNEAAKLFRKIIEVQPKNKAAKIRLRECIEKQPNVNEDEDINNSELESVVKQKEKINNNENFNSTLPENQSEEKDYEEINEEPTEKPDTFTDEIKRLQKKYDLKQKYSDAELQKMYEEAIYTMFQNNYVEAAKMFHQILRIRPENKAARIRLQECKEASGNA